MKQLLFSTVVAFLVGCVANPYHEFYHQKSIANGLGAEDPNSNAPTPEVKQGANVDSDYREMLDAGFTPLGFSAFSAGDIGDWQAGAQGKRVHADIVIVYKKYQGTVTSQVPVTMPNNQTTVSNFNGTAGGQSFSGSGSSTTYGTQTTYVPMSVNRYEYFAGYWAKNPLRTPAEK